MVKKLDRHMNTLMLLIGNWIGMFFSFTVVSILPSTFSKTGKKTGGSVMMATKTTVSVRTPSLLHWWPANETRNISSWPGCLCFSTKWRIRTSLTVSLFWKILNVPFHFEQRNGFILADWKRFQCLHNKKKHKMRDFSKIEKNLTNFDVMKIWTDKSEVILNHRCRNY